MKKNNKLPGKVYFVGAGPGAKDLLTIRGKRVIDKAACIIYTGSLVSDELFEDSDAEIIDSKGLDLDRIVEIIKSKIKTGLDVARVHTGDPSLYGAIKEQMVRLEEAGIRYEIVPGVTSAFAAAATMKAELTLPEVTQTVIITRRGGKTPVPEREKIAHLARHQTTMLIYLSVGMITEVTEELLEGGFPSDTPVSVVQRASWPDEKIVSGTIDDIAAKVEKEGIKKTAMICVGKAFGNDTLVAESKLYDKHFSHGERMAQREKDGARCP